MNALETAIDKLRAMQVGQFKGKSFFDLPSIERADIIMAYMAENPEQVNDLLDDVSEELIADIFGYLASRNWSDAARIMALAMANTPAGGDILAAMEKLAERALHDREVENRYESTRLQGAVVYYMM